MSRGSPCVVCGDRVRRMAELAALGPTVCLSCYHGENGSAAAATAVQVMAWADQAIARDNESDPQSPKPGVAA